MRPGKAVVLRADATNLPLEDSSVDLIVTSPPYFALRSYRDGDEHYDGQIGSEPTPAEFLEALWRSTEEMVRVLKPSGSIFVNLGDKYAGSGGHNNSGIGAKDQRGPKAYIKNAQVEADRRGIGAKALREDPGLRRLKPSEAGVRNKSLLLLPERYRIGCVDRLGLIVRQVQIWSKPNGLPESVTDRTRRSHEDWVHMVKEPRYFAAVDEIREPQNSLGERHEGRSGYVNAKGVPGGEGVARSFETRSLNPLGKLPGSVWTIPTEPLRIPEWARKKLDLPDHFAAFPTEWPRRLILGWSPPAGVVLDPFGGTGTTALVATTLGRDAISVDLSADYSRLAKWRISQSGHGRKALSRTMKERQGAMEGLA